MRLFQFLFCFVLFWLVLPFREGRILYGLVKKHLIVSYLQIFDTQNYILFKIAASGLLYS